MADQTAVVFDTGGDMFFFIVDEDWERFAGVDLDDSVSSEEIKADLLRCIYSDVENRRFRHDPVEHDEWDRAVKAGVNVVVCGNNG